MSVSVDTFGTCVIAEEELEKLIVKKFDMRPAAIIEALKLQNPVYRRTACYGHFGREEEGFTWELRDRVDELKAGV